MQDQPAAAEEVAAEFRADRTAQSPSDGLFGATAAAVEPLAAKFRLRCQPQRGGKFEGWLELCEHPPVRRRALSSEGGPLAERVIKFKGYGISTEACLHAEGVVSPLVPERAEEPVVSLA